MGAWFSREMKNFACREVFEQEVFFLAHYIAIYKQSDVDKTKINWKGK